MLAFMTRMFKDKYKSLIIYTIAAIAFLELYVILFPTIETMSAQLNEMMKAMPAEFFKAFNMDPSNLSFNNIETLLATKHFNMIWPIMTIIMAINTGGYLIINEIDKGTAEVLLSLPVKRSKIFISRYLTGLLIILAFCAASIFAIFPLAWISNVSFIWQNHVTLFIGAALFAWFCYSLATLVSMFFSEKSKATMVTGGIILVAYFVNIIASLKDSLANLKYISLFNYFNSETLLIKNSFPDYMFIVFGVSIALFTVLAFFKFRSRDISCL